MLFLSAGLPAPASASHNLAGQITASRLNANTYRITLVTYTDPAPAGVDRCSADIEIWDPAGTQLLTTISEIPRANGPPDNSPDCMLTNANSGEVFYGTIKRNYYYATFTFPGPGSYLVRYFDVARWESLTNVDDAGNTAFYVETIINIPNPLLGLNNTPILLNDPIDEACVGKLWTHNPGGFDPDGDSLVYELIIPRRYDNSAQPGPQQNINPPLPVINYLYPDDPVFGNSTFSIDPETGLLTWDVPPIIGNFAIAYQVSEYRNGLFLGHVVRDMVIFVQNCDNDPPVIESITDTCITAGEFLKFDFKAWDPDDSDSIYLELNNAGLGNNGPFSVANPAVITLTNPPGGTLPVGLPPSPAIPDDTIKGSISWSTVCDNIRQSFYQIDFYAHDNFSYISAPGLVMLSAHHVIKINVIPPPPSGLTATKGSRQILLNWDPSACDNAVGYRVYRKIGSPGFQQDTVCCDQSPSAAGYQLIAFNEGWTNTSYVDSLTGISNIFGTDICYLVTAMFGDPFNPKIESCATEEECVEIMNDRLFLTNDSVNVTDAVNGSIFLSWSQPDFIDSFFPGPFTYRLYRANNNQFPAIPVASLPYGDTTYTDLGIDTEIRGYNYRVELFDDLGLLVFTGNGENTGSSIYLSATGGNNVVSLSWREFVPWFNDTYEIYRSDNGGPFNLIATLSGTGANTHSYIDQNLDPSIEFCYFIRSYGSHNVAGVKPVLINDSQKDCAYARDEDPPCNPAVDAQGNCETFVHLVTITKPPGLDCDDDTEFVTLQFATTPAGPYMPVQILPYSSFLTDTTLIFNFNENIEAFAGCYSITATDTLGNTSSLSDPICIDYCPALELGNVFTPNGDGINDYFTPVLHRSAVLKEILIFDRWGKLLHTNTSDIERLWDGRIDGSGTDAREGVYYFYIRYELRRLAGNEQGEAKGWVTLLR